jgi:hypothetical protein
MSRFLRTVFTSAGGMPTWPLTHVEQADFFAVTTMHFDRSGLRIVRIPRQTRQRNTIRSDLGQGRSGLKGNWELARGAR